MRFGWLGLLVFLLCGCSEQPEMREVFVYSGKGTRPVFEPDPSRLVQKIDAVKGPMGMGDGPSGNWSNDFHQGGVVTFADGSTESMPTMSVVGKEGQTLRVGLGTPDPTN